MEKLQTDKMQSEAVSKKNRPMLGILVLCLLLGFGIVLSLVLIGSSIGQFSGREENVIPLLPTEDVSMNSGDNRITYLSYNETEQILDVKTADTSNKDLSQQASGNTGNTSGRLDANNGVLQVFDDKQIWSSETHVELFKNSYDGTVKSENGEKVIAPGTSNFYGFTVKNNGDVPLDYSISLEVDTYLGEDENYSELPLQWRLLSGDGTAVSDWKTYNERTEVLKSSTLAVRNQDSYKIEWRWAFERGGNADNADTGIGNTAINKPVGANASIYINAEQSPNPVRNPSGSGGIIKTGDSSNIVLYIILMAISICVLLILVVLYRRKKNDKDK